MRKAALLFAWCIACEIQRPQVEHRALSKSVERTVAAANGLSSRAASLNESWVRADSHYAEAKRNFVVAGNVSREARAASSEASETLDQAASTWKQAEKTWRVNQQLVQVAAGLDAHNLDRSRAYGRGEAGALECDDGMSTAAFRRLLLAAGANLVGKDVDHIVPRSLGGADHPTNFRVIASAKNRSWGDGWGREKCADAGARCEGAIAVSRKCGSYGGPSF